MQSPNTRAMNIGFKQGRPSFLKKKKCFRIICWFLQTLDYRGNEKYVLVLVQCHDRMITNLINLVCKTKQIYLVHDHRIMTLDSNQNLIVILSLLLFPLSFASVCITYIYTCK